MSPLRPLADRERPVEDRAEEGLGAGPITFDERHPRRCSFTSCLPTHHLGRSSFRVRVTALGDKAGRDYLLDWIPARVHWGPGAQAGAAAPCR
jgi:hypothetical protein